MKSAFSIAALTGAANAFWGTGHLLVSRHAQAILEAENPAAFNWALDMLTTLREDDPVLVTEENKHPFTECATFADDIKGKGFWWQSDWHFIDLPYFSQGNDISDYPNYKMSTRDVVQALGSLTDWIKGVPGADDSVYAYDIMIDYPYVPDAQSFALRLIIHYIGDIHQPLHTTSEVND